LVKVITESGSVYHVNGKKVTGGKLPVGVVATIPPGFECPKVGAAIYATWDKMYIRTSRVVREVETVPDGQECPNCNEDRVDALVWIDDGEQVECLTCGHVYTLG